MSAAIGSASLILTTNSSQMTAGAGKAASEVKGKLSGIGSGLGGTFSKLGGLLKGGLIAGAVAGAAGAVVAVVGAIDSIRGLAEQGNMAASLGMTAEAFTGLAGAAERYGVDAGGVFEGLVELSNKAQEALAGGEVGETFRRLGIDAQQFAGLNPGEQFEQLHAALQGVQDPAERTRILMQTMGEEAGVKLAPLLNKSTEELRALTAQFATSTADMEKIRRADEAMKQVQATIGRVWRQAVVALAPIIEFFSVRLNGAIEALQPVFDWLSRAFTTHWGIILDILGEVFDAIGEVVSAVADWVKSLFGLQETTTTIEEVVTGVWRAIGIAGAYAWDAIKAGMGVVAIGVGFVVKGLAGLIDLFADVVGLAKELPEELRPAGLDRFIAGVEQVRSGVKETGDEIENWGKDAVNGFGNSANKVRAWFDKRGERQAAPGAAAGPGGRAAPAEEKPLEYKAVGAMLMGSKEAYSLEAKFRTENSLKQDRENKQLEELKQIRELMREVVRGVTGIELPALELR